MMNDGADPGYRPCVGLMLINHQGLVFSGRRVNALKGLKQHEWQMPQGGIDEGEDVYCAALRELIEETGISSVELLASSKQWLKYDLPGGIPKHWNGRYKGQTQKWFALKFTGTDDEINLNYSPHVEFSQWCWMSPQEIVNKVVPFKRTVYETVIAEFDQFTKVSS